MKTGWFIGRFQPFHDGHKAMIEQILKECNYCVVLIREMRQSDDNPYTASTIKKWISDWAKEKPVDVQIVHSGSDMTVYYGRDVGWDFKELKLPKEIEDISATKVRNDNLGHRAKRQR